MKQEHLQPQVSKKRVYSSYKGEITPEVPNVIQRNFHAHYPNEKGLTDITEFSIPAGKVYFSPMIDCFDGMPVSWRISVSSNGELVNRGTDDPHRYFCFQSIGQGVSREAWRFASAVGYRKQKALQKMKRLLAG